MQTKKTGCKQKRSDANKSTVAYKGQCNKKWFAVNKKDRMQTKKIGCKQERSDANKKDRMQTKKIGCKQKRSNANKKDWMQTKNQNLSRCNV